MTASTQAPTFPKLAALVSPPTGNVARSSSGGTASGEPQFSPPRPSRTPQLLRRVQAAAALAVLIFGGVGALLISGLRTDQDAAPQIDAQYARIGEVQTRLLGAATLATEGVIKGNGGTTDSAAQAVSRVGEAVGLLVEAATARPQDAPALTSISREVTVYGMLLKAADQRDAKSAQAQLTLAANQLDNNVLPDLDRLRGSLSVEASATSSGLTWVMPVLGLLVLALLGWTSWLVAQRSHRVLNIGLIAAVVAVVVTGWITIEAQQATERAANESRTTQFAAVSALHEASAQVDIARNLQTRSLLAKAWTAADAEAVDAALTAADKATEPAKASAILGTYRTAEAALATLMAKGDWPGATKLALSTDKVAVAPTAARFQQAISDARVVATTAAADAATEVRNSLPWQLAAVILAALVGAGMVIAGLAQRLVEYR
jgi:hypothetical protein